MNEYWRENGVWQILDFLSVSLGIKVKSGPIKVNQPFTYALLEKFEIRHLGDN